MEEVPLPLIASIEEAMNGVVMLDDHQSAHACWALYYLCQSMGGLWSPEIEQSFDRLAHPENDTVEEQGDKVRAVIKDVTDEVIRWMIRHDIPSVMWLMVSPCGEVEEYVISQLSQRVEVDSWTDDYE